MAAPIEQRPHPVFDHDGPWTEEAYLALPEDKRIELLDGSLLVSPYANSRHQRFSGRFRAAVDAVLRIGLEILETVNVRVGSGRMFIPDIVIVTNPGAEVVVYDAADLLMVIEIVSRGNTMVDRVLKPQAYAEAGIPYYLRIEQEGPSAVAYRLADGRYVEYARSEVGERLVLADPFVLDVDLAALATATRPS